MSWAPILSLIGPTGSVGSVGSVGSTGPYGSQVTPRGPWVSMDSYVVNDVAVSTLDNNAYICTVADAESDTDPSVNVSWTLYLTSGPTGPQGDTGFTGPSGQTVNEQGLWVLSNAYVVNDVALSGLDNNAYICILDDLISSLDPSLNNTNWTLYLYGGPTGAVGPTGIMGPTGAGVAGSIGSQIYGLGYSPQGTLDGVTGPVGATGPSNAGLLDYVFDLQNGLIWQPKRWNVSPIDNIGNGATGDYKVNTQPDGVTASSALLAPVSSVTYNVDANVTNNLAGNTGFMIVGRSSVMDSQGTTGTMYINGVQAGLAGTFTHLCNGTGDYGSTGATVFDLTGTPWVDGSNIVVFEPSNSLSLVPDLAFTLDIAKFI